MAYIKYKEVTKYFYFNKVFSRNKLPKYVIDYLAKNETIWVAYKTKTDHGIFTDSEIILFDNYSLLGKKKTIYAISYKSISTFSVIFNSTSAELLINLDCGYPVVLKFVNMKAEDKLRLRYLYNCVLRVVNNQELDMEIVNNLIIDNIKFDD